MDKDKELELLEALDNELEPLTGADEEQGRLLFELLDILDDPSEWTEEQVDNVFKAAEYYADRWLERYGSFIIEGINKCEPDV
jgi:hypothetical protein